MVLKRLECLEHWIEKQLKLEANIARQITEVKLMHDVLFWREDPFTAHKFFNERCDIRLNVLPSVSLIC